MVEFAINNSKNTLTGASPFYLNYSDHPWTPHVYGFPSRLAESPRAKEREQDFVVDRIPVVRQVSVKIQEVLQ